MLLTVLIVYFSCASCSEKSVENTFGSNVEIASTDYCTSMRAQVEHIVSEINGVGSATVVINWDRSSSQTSFGNTSTENPKAVGSLIVCEG